MSFTIDASKFEKEFKDLDKKFRGKYGEEAMIKALQALKIDADTITPTVPKEIGTLRSDVIFEVKNKIGQIVGELIWNQKYAARLHEAPNGWNWTEPGSGPDYAGSKLEKRGDKYLAVMGMVYKSKQ